MHLSQRVGKWSLVGGLEDLRHWVKTYLKGVGWKEAMQSRTVSWIRFVQMAHRIS